MKILSLFSNIGVAEAYLEDAGFEVVLANELVKRRANLYSQIYPQTEMVCGDITDEEIYQTLLRKSRARGIDIILATPPCQGASRAGKQKQYDERNTLIFPVIRAIQDLKPMYAFIENVPQFLETKVKLNEYDILIPELLSQMLSKEFDVDINIVNTKNYSVPQTRERAVILVTRKDIEKKWKIPPVDPEVVSLQDVIGNLPPIDPMIRDVTEDELLEIFPHFYKRKEEALGISPWHKPPEHVKRQVVTMMHTPTGCTAFDNPKYYPIKIDGDPVSGYKSTYRRLRWVDPASTITMDNRKISSQNNVHPGRYIGLDEGGDVMYTDARALTVYELMKVMSLPDDWPVPTNTSESFFRSIIGEGIPPLFVKKVFEKLL
ncbi:DNA cytosine methyltransferase [Paenibacillus wynnii]|uniref:DNA cytosine methyltransferase n=1 Tax=Paenibacillus wynnii TaxID=268407 RepID=UPI0027906773|nr:DNA cytosine methyltransferase [Paenibacillus wynnii]MDQ0195737.1 DNA (cytosine-5)-methyltransferase 1 [Paenibacillus wynnii]